MAAQLRRDQVLGLSDGPVARSIVKRLMRSLGLRGVRRGQPVITTPADRQSERAPDLVDRDFSAARPNQLWVVDLTYAHRRMALRRACPTELPLDALKMALWTRERASQTRDGRLDG